MELLADGYKATLSNEKKNMLQAIPVPLAASIFSSHCRSGGWALLLHVEGWDGTLEGELEGEPYIFSTTGLKPVKERPIIRWTTDVQYGKVVTIT
jgi:hypothetical protein